MIKVGFAAIADISIPGVFWRQPSNLWVHLELYYRNFDNLRKVRYTAKPDSDIQLNYRGEVHTQASCETVSKSEGFEYQGTKWFLL